MEIKKERFKRVAAKRVKNLLAGIRSLSNCSNTNNYEYTDMEVQKMMKAIKDELRTMEIMYKKNLNKRNDSFNF